MNKLNEVLKALKAAKIRTGNISLTLELGGDGTYVYLMDYSYYGKVLGHCPVTEDVIEMIREATGGAS